MDGLLTLWNETAIANFKFEQLIMILVGCGLLFLAIKKDLNRYYYYQLVLVRY